MTITVLISIHCHMVIVGIYNHLRSLPIPYSLRLQEAPRLVVVL